MPPSGRFVLANSLLIGAQACIVALPAAGVPAWLRRFGGRGWSIVLPASIVVVVVAIALVPTSARGIAWLALVTVPVLAASALAWAMRGARPAAALLVVPLFAAAWADGGRPAGQVAAVVLSALSCVTLGRLLAGAVPAAALRAGIVAMAAVDALFVFGDVLQEPNRVFVAAAPVSSLPRFQVLALGPASIDYGDVFIAGVLGGLLAARGMRQGRVALLTFALSAVFDLLFLVYDTLPATVPVAAGLLVAERWDRVATRLDSSAAL